MKPHRIALALLTLLATSACTHTSYTDKDGNKFTRTSLGTTQNIGKIEVTASATEKHLVVDGYANEQAQVASAVVNAALSAIKK